MMVPAELRLLPLLHGDPRGPRGPFWTNWQIAPTVLLGVFALTAGYPLLTGSRTAAERPVSRRQRGSFFAGCVALLVALGPPLEDWAGLLVSAHMAQHLILMLVAPPLLLFGTPAWLLAPLLRWRLIARAGYLLTWPVVALLSSLVVILWRLPALREAAMRMELVHVAQHLFFLATAVLVWWPLLGPLPEWPRASPLTQMLLLVALTIPGAIVGSFLSRRWRPASIPRTPRRRACGVSTWPPTSKSPG